MIAPSESATELLIRWRSGETHARDQLFDQCYADLHQAARRILRNDSVAAELRPTELLHECAMRLFQLDRIDWQNRAHFLALSAQIMRRTLVDQARMMRADKRQMPLTITLLNTGQEPVAESFEIEALHRALEDLSQTSPEHSSIVEMRFFGGMTNDQIAEVMGISARTVKRQWRSARAWLESELRRADA